MNSPFKIINAKDTVETFLQDFGNDSNGYVKIAQFGQEIMNATRTYQMNWEVPPMKPACLWNNLLFNCS